MKFFSVSRLSLCFALLAAIIYLIITLKEKKQAHLSHALECMMNGAGVLGGLFLMVCAFLPHNLVNLVNSQGIRQPNPLNIFIEIDPEKSLCILVGGFAILFLASANLAAIYSGQKQRPLEPKPPGSRPTKGKG